MVTITQQESTWQKIVRINPIIANASEYIKNSDPEDADESTREADLQKEIKAEKS